ncbi:uncharacterized protein LOC132314453 [Cornus florida]|uniref:uncharacterized protein LOC132314453 n=1 Tax=Cornus florida TaxID=4283 RepID=UPI002898B75E|nr:uncharacterized protein LOC132314453 [Cornus florida]
MAAHNEEDNITDIVDHSDRLTAVGQQGHCSCCYAWTGLGCIEFLLNKDKQPNDFVVLSKQELADCVPVKFPPKEDAKPDLVGCYTSSINQAFRYVKKYGVNTEENYGYVGRRGACRTDFDNIQEENRHWITDFETIDCENESEILRALVKQPLAASMTAYKSLRELREEIYEGPKPGEKGAGHAIILSSWGTDVDTGKKCSGRGAKSRTLNVISAGSCNYMDAELVLIVSSTDGKYRVDFNHVL